MASPPLSAPPRAGFVPALDGVRGLAVLVVIIHNSGWVSSGSSQPLVKLFSAAAATGWAGVELFFALSGFLITGILLDTRGQPGYFRTFFVRRSLRIFPLYYALVAGTVFLAAPLAWDPAWVAEVRAHQWAYWVYLQNWTEPFQVSIHGLTHLWSLAVEEQFYLVWPLVAWWLGARKVATLSALLVLSAPFVRAGLLAAGLPTWAAYMWTVSRWDALAAGALLAALLRDPVGRAQVARWLLPVTVAAGGALAALVLRQRGFHSEEWPVLVVGQSLVSILSACLLAALVGDGAARWPWAGRWLSAGWLRHLGRHSYAMYLFHMPLHHLLKPFVTPWITAGDDPWRLARVLAHVGTVFLLTYAASRLSWALLEAPLLAWKDRWAPATPGAPSPPDGGEVRPQRLAHPRAGEAVVALRQVAD